MFTSNKRLQTLSTQPLEKKWKHVKQMNLFQNPLHLLHKKTQKQQTKQPPTHLQILQKPPLRQSIILVDLKCSPLNKDGHTWTELQHSTMCDHDTETTDKV